jgi:hypothetical protein
MNYVVYAWYPQNAFTYSKKVDVFYVSSNHLAQDPPPLSGQMSGQIYPRGFSK